MYHHSAESYDVASNRAATWAREKLAAVIRKGREQAQHVLEEVDRTLIDDYVVGARNMNFVASQEGTVALRFDDKGLSLHEHALNQIVTKLDGTKKVSDWAYTTETAEEFASILNKKLRKQSGRRFLVRSVGAEARGIMSDRYRRLDVRPMVGAVVKTAIEEYGAVPTEARMLPTSFNMKMVLPTIYEPVPNEVGVFGLVFRNSDFGAGRLYVKGFFHRLWCTNLAMTEDGISQVHLGGRLEDGFLFSQKTYELDTQTMASALGDVVRNVFSGDNIRRRMDMVKAASKEDGFDVGKALKGLQSGTKLLKGEAASVAEAFNSADVQLLPQGNTRWRLSNAISLIAQQADPDRQLELETLAGEVAGLAA